MVPYLEYTRKSFVSPTLLLALILTSAFVTVIASSPAQAETGKGKDVFKVILTMFGANNSKGDIVAIVTVNNGEA